METSSNHATGKVLRHALAAAVLALAALPAFGQPNRTVIDGDKWMQSSEEVRKAFLLGASSMIAMEQAYSEKKGTLPPPVAAQMRQAVQGMTIDDVQTRITRWYERNPARRNMPVLGVIWVDIVKPQQQK